MVVGQRARGAQRVAAIRHLDIQLARQIGGDRRARVRLAIAMRRAARPLSRLHQAPPRAHAARRQLSRTPERALALQYGLSGPDVLGAAGSDGGFVHHVHAHVRNRSSGWRRQVELQYDLRALRRVPISLPGSPA